MSTVDNFGATGEPPTHPELLDALTVEKEPLKVAERYGKNSHGRRVLAARRLVEAGVPFVYTHFESKWDHHGHNFRACKEKLPNLDKAVASLIEDLHDRGLLEKTVVMVLGEMGRTPKINKDSDRKVVVAVRPDGIHELGGEPRAWKRVVKKGYFGWHTNCAYDAKHKAVVVFGSNENRDELAVYLPKTAEYKLMPTAGTRPPKDQHNPMEFHPDLGKTVLLVKRAEGDKKNTETWLYDLGADSWERVKGADLPFACGMNYNMEFDPVHRVMLLVTGGDGAPTRVWALRLKPAK